MTDHQPPVEPIEDAAELGAAVVGDEQACRFPDDLVSRPAVQALCPPVPSSDGSVELRPHDGIVGALRDGGEPGVLRLRRAPLGDVREVADDGADGGVSE
jgi:hypothetical protein